MSEEEVLVKNTIHDENACLAVGDRGWWRRGSSSRSNLPSTTRKRTTAPDNERFPIALLHT